MRNILILFVGFIVELEGHPFFRLSYTFRDENINGYLESDERGKLKLYINNDGETAYNTTVHLSVPDKKFSNKINIEPRVCNIGIIEKNTEKHLVITIVGKDLPIDTVRIKIEIEEKQKSGEIINAFGFVSIPTLGLTEEEPVTKLGHEIIEDKLEVPSAKEKDSAYKEKNGISQIPDQPSQIGGWYYISIIQPGGILPPNLKSDFLKFSVGFTPPAGLGIGTSVYSLTLGSLYSRKLFPVHLYYLPYVKWNEKGDVSFAFYFFFSLNPVNFGCGFAIPHMELEGGYDTFGEKHSIYIRFNLSTTTWKAIGKKKPTPPVERIVHEEEPYLPQKEKPAIKTEPMQLPTQQVSRFPPDLIISQITFTEPSGNKALDAYEKGDISFVIENSGKGDAQGVNIRVVPLAGEGQLEYAKQFDVGTIPANSQKSVRIPINATGETKDEIVKLRIEIYEQYGFDADPFIISFETRKFNPAILTIGSIAIDDDKEGDSYGDNDGVIELGEQIEVSIAIQNKGMGDANNTTVELIIPDEGKNLYYNSPSHQFTLGNIISGGYKQLGFVLALAKRYDKEAILVKTKMIESTGKAKIDSVYLPVGKPSGYGREIAIIAQQEKPVKPTEVPVGIDIEQPVEKYGEPKENGLCVIIGIEEYKKAPPSLYSNRDATAFYEYAKNVLGIKERNIYITTNEDATKGEFDKIFGEDGWLARRVNSESEIFIYFSGHGSADMKTQKQYLVPYDIDPNYPQTAYSLDKIYECMGKLGAKSVVVFLDACFSGQSREGRILLAGARPLVVSKITEPLENITVFTATSGPEIASAYTEKKHGLFTYYLLKGLRQEADLNKDKTITTKELFNYLTNRVSDAAQDMGREQHPQLLGEKDNELVKFK